MEFVLGTDQADVLVGIDSSQINGIGGDDSILGGVGRSYLFGGDGNDRIKGGGGSGYMEGGAGDDWIFADNRDGQRATLFGDTGNDTLIGGFGNTSLYGGDGNDTLHGSTWPNILDAGTGSDTVVGGNWTDQIVLGDMDATDSIDGRAGKDFLTVVKVIKTPTNLEFREGNLSWNGHTIAWNIEGLTLATGSGNDVLILEWGSRSEWGHANAVHTGAGNDRIEGNASAVLYAVGEAGDDILSGAGTLIGAVGHDTLTLLAGGGTASGNTGRDTLIGSNGRDVLNGGSGDDSLSGQGGADRIDAGSGHDTVAAGDGNDTVQFDDWSPEDRADGGAGSDTLWLSGSDANDVVDLRPVAGVVTGFEQILFNAGKGDDILLGGEMSNLGGGDGNDTITLGDNGGTARGDSGRDTLFGGSGHDSLEGGWGADTLDGGAGADSLNGGPGSDLYIVDQAGDVVWDNGSGDRDVVLSPLDWTLSDYIEELRLVGAAVQGTGNREDNWILGTDFANTLVGRGGIDHLIGMGGNDHLTGEDIGDRLEGGTGDDQYAVTSYGVDIIEAAGAGIDNVVATVGVILDPNLENLVLTTGSRAVSGRGNDSDNRITGNERRNYLSGEAGNDHLSGMDGNDVLDGGLGADRMVGGTGNDKYVVDSAKDIISEAPDDGIDTVLSYVDFSLNDRLERLTLVGTADIAGNGNGQANTLLGNKGANTLRGLGGNDRIGAGRGADTLWGGDGNDRLMGEWGNDTIWGGSGNDRIFGGSGRDLLYGGSGADRFLLQGGHAIVADFEKGIDRIVLSAELWPTTEAPSITSLMSHGRIVGGNAVFELDESRVLTVLGVTDLDDLRGDLDWNWF
ncbi:calcium-binding protein [Rubellimicrobium arenae]|uniref:calcium-binding protein n=1 Tax=Rubellimicrobium arenae TaxID=2817372 RepID=UPI001B30DCD0|nr:calcium-binding protein [Rubellimicrobium arenae]